MVNQAVHSDINAQICIGEAFEMNGQFYSQSGTYVDTLIGGSSVGCDSIINLELEVIGRPPKLLG